jgi:hypothetical protein
LTIISGYIVEQNMNLSNQNILIGITDEQKDYLIFSEKTLLIR